LYNLCLSYISNENDSDFTGVYMAAERNKQNPNQRSGHAMWLFREFCAIAFWLYVIMKVAIYDFDIYIISTYAPSLVKVVPYKFLLLLVSISILWLVLGKKRFPIFAAYLLFYPFVILFYKVPQLFFRSWSSIIILSPAIFGLLTTFRALFIRSTFTIAAAICILVSSNVIVLSMSMVILGVALMFHIYSSFRNAYGSSFFTKIRQGVSRLKSNLLSETSFILKACMPRTEAVSDVQLRGNILTLYAVHWGFDIATEKVREVIRTHKMDIYFILVWMWTVLFTLTIYTFEYLALYKIDPTSFTTPIVFYKFNFLSFLGFSFGQLITSGMSSVLPASLGSKLLYYSELFCKMAIFTILIFIILKASRERYKEEVESILSDLGQIVLLLQGSFQKLFNLALAEAETVLLKDNASIVNKLRQWRGLPELPPPNPEGAEKTQLEEPRAGGPSTT